MVTNNFTGIDLSALEHKVRNHNYSFEVLINQNYTAGIKQKKVRNDILLLINN